MKRDEYINCCPTVLTSLSLPKFVTPSISLAWFLASFAKMMYFKFAWVVVGALFSIGFALTTDVETRSQPGKPNISNLRDVSHTVILDIIL